MSVFGTAPIRAPGRGAGFRPGLRRIQPLLLAAAALPLSGCVAAAVLPLAASGAILGTRVHQGPGDDLAAGPAPPLPALRANIPRAATNGARAVLLEGVSELPPPSADNAITGIEALRAYVERLIAGAERPVSALLDDPAALTLARTPCGEKGSAVLLDLDPASGVARLDQAPAGASPFAPILMRLRDRDIAIGWITDHPPAAARAIRRTLAETGLDPAGQDPLLVRRYPGESKQARRRAFGAAHCLLAIGGDNREDFDELFGYLRQPDAATPFEAMLGNGWFLIADPI